MFTKLIMFDLRKTNSARIDINKLGKLIYVFNKSLTFSNSDSIFCEFFAINWEKDNIVTNLLIFR
jgi:hypothetical protein